MIIDLTRDLEYGSREKVFSKDKDSDLQIKRLIHQDRDSVSIAVSSNTQPVNRKGLIYLINFSVYNFRLLLVYLFVPYL